jgi:hypothetical protein
LISVSAIIIQRSSLQPINQSVRRWLVFGRLYGWVVSLHQIIGPRFYVSCFARGHQIPLLANSVSKSKMVLLHAGKPTFAILFWLFGFPAPKDLKLFGLQAFGSRLW